MTFALIGLVQVVWRMWFKPVTDAREQMIWDYLKYQGKEFAK